MRALALPLAAVVSACACSVQESTIQGDPVTAVTVEAAAAPIDAPKHAKFRYGSSENMSCSLSWETESDWGDYELTLTPPHAATLKVERHHETRFGQNGKMGPGTTYDQGDWKNDFEGTVARVGDELRVELHAAETTCASKDTPCSSLSLTCKAAKPSVVSYDDKGRHEAGVDALRCTPGYGLPEKFTGELNALFFREAKTLVLEYEQFSRFGDEMGPELRESSY